MTAHAADTDRAWARAMGRAEWLLMLAWVAGDDPELEDDEPPLVEWRD